MTATPLRILYHHRIAATDGMRVHVAKLVEALRARGHLVKVVGPGAGGETVQAGVATGLERAAERLRRTLPAAGYELLELLYNVPAYLRLRAATEAFRPDLIYERYNLFLFAGLLLKQRRGLPLLLEVNSPLARERAEFGGLRFRALARRCEAALWRGADVVLPVTHVLAGDVCRVRHGQGGVQVIPNGTDAERPADPLAAEPVRRRLGLGPDALVLGFVGFARAWHGLGWAIEALPILPPNTHLVIVGDGPVLKSLKTRALELGIGARLHIAGSVPHDEVAAHIQIFDVALQTAATAYASPLKLFEYMGLGRAIIAPDQANIREVLSAGRDALLFEPQSRDSFCSALQRLCGDAALRARLGAGARKTVRETPLTWARNAERIEGLARELIRRRPVSVGAGVPAASVAESP